MPDSAPAPDIAHRLDVARAIAEDAADRLRGAFRRGAAQVSAKADGTVVTEVDRAVEAAISRAIEAAFPDDGRLGEEHGEVAGASGVRWVIDPIDGTFSFIRGVPLFGTLIGIEVDGVARAGVIAMPALNESVWGGPGLGAWRWAEGEVTPARVSTIVRAEEALFCTTGLGGWRRGGRLDTFTRLATTFGRMRGWSDCYAYTLLATGRCDVVIEPELNWWDIAAVIPIIEAAGGRVTDWQGQPCAVTGDIATLATNGALHEQALAALATSGE